jgi:hypothetical protein
MGYDVSALMKFYINFPSQEKQKEMIGDDQKYIEDNLVLCRENLRNFSLENIDDNEAIKLILKEANITTFIDYDFPPVQKEIVISNKE